MNEAKKLTKEYRLRQWSALIHERISSGKKTDDWCKEHGSKEFMPACINKTSWSIV